MIITYYYHNIKILYRVNRLYTQDAQINTIAIRMAKRDHTRDHRIVDIGRQ